MNLGTIAHNLKSRKAKDLRFTRGLFAPAINELNIALDTMKTNAPINEREGNKGQAKLERDNAKSYKAAIGLLKKAE